MSLSVGSKAPDFTLEGTNGSFTLSENFKSRPCIIYFYPKDFTNVCTKEACSFRDEFSVFKGMDIDIIGISKDDVETHQKFKAQYALPFELLADTEGAVSRQYDALVPFIKVTKRITYLLDEHHQIVASYSNIFEADHHVNAMLEKVKEMQTKRQGGNL